MVSPVRAVGVNHLVEGLYTRIAGSQPVVLRPNVSVAEGLELNPGGAAEDHELVCLACIRTANEDVFGIVEHFAAEGQGELRVKPEFPPDKSRYHQPALHRIRNLALRALEGKVGLGDKVPTGRRVPPGKQVVEEIIPVYC